MSTRSMLVLLSADEMVKPPMRSMIVGENMPEKTYLRGRKGLNVRRTGRHVAILRCRRGRKTIPMLITDDLQEDEEHRDKHGRDKQRNSLRIVNSRRSSTKKYTYLRGPQERTKY